MVKRFSCLDFCQFSGSLTQGFLPEFQSGMVKNLTLITMLSYQFRREVYTIGHNKQCIPAAHPDCFIG